MNSLEQGKNAMSPEETTSGNDVHYRSEEDRKMAWTRGNGVKHFMQMELDSCRDGLLWLIRYHNCAADICPEKEYPRRPLPIPPDYIENLQRRLEKPMNGILPPTLTMILKTYYLLPVRQAPVHPQQKVVSPYSQEEQLETSLEVQPDGMTGKHGEGECNSLE